MAHSDHTHRISRRNPPLPKVRRQRRWRRRLGGRGPVRIALPRRGT